MWIVPKNLLPQWNGAPATEAFISDLAEQSRIFASLLLVRSKPSLVRTWLLKWKRDSWSQHLSGRILKPSLQQPLQTKWISLWPDTLASHSVTPESVEEQTTSDTSGLSFWTESNSCDQDSASLKTSRDTSPSDSEKSLATWKMLVTQQRGEYSQRLKSAHLTREKESLSWPTTTTRDHKGCGNAVDRKDGKSRLDTIEAVVKYGLPAQDSRSTSGNRQESWLTPRSYETNENSEKFVARNGDRGKHCHGTLTAQSGGKLNPRWVETLMGLPIGWTMPSCTSPVTIVSMNSDCLETEWCLQQRQEHGKYYTKGWPSARATDWKDGRESHARRTEGVMSGMLPAAVKDVMNGVSL